MDCRSIEREETSMKWISVKDRLPEDGTSVLICGHETYTCQAHIWEGKWFYDGIIDSAAKPS